MGEDGFEPSKLKATDLQSAPFGRSGTLPYYVEAGGRTRTPDLLITNQLLYQLSYTSINRGDRSRTCGILVPNQALYQTELRLDINSYCSSDSFIIIQQLNWFVNRFFKKIKNFLCKIVLLIESD